MKEMGAYFVQKLRELEASTSAIAEIRGCGLMIGVELKEPNGTAVVSACRDKGLLINCVGDKVLRFVPPLIIEKADVDAAVQILGNVLSKMH